MPPDIRLQFASPPCSALAVWLFRDQNDVTKDGTRSSYLFCPGERASGRLSIVTALRPRWLPIGHKLAKPSIVLHSEDACRPQYTIPVYKGAFGFCVPVSVLSVRSVQGFAEMPIFKTVSLFLVMVATILAGCAGGGAKFKPSALKGGNGLIYVYMPPNFVMSNTKGLLTIAVDGKEVGNIGPGVYYPIRVKPGLRRVKLGNHMNFGLALTGRDTISVPVAAGKTYYVRLSLVSYTPTAQSVIPERVGERVGRAEIRATHKG